MMFAAAAAAADADGGVADAGAAGADAVVVEPPCWFDTGVRVQTRSRNNTATRADTCDFCIPCSSFRSIQTKAGV